MSVFDGEIPKLVGAVQQVAENIAYIQRELPRLEMPDEIRTDLTGVCDQFEWALIDTRNEIQNLADDLRSRSDEVRPDPKAEIPNENASVAFISYGLRDAIAELHEIVTRLHHDSESDMKMGVVYLLISESATNILKSFSIIRESLNRIDSSFNLQPGT